MNSYNLLIICNVSWKT